MSRLIPVSVLVSATLLAPAADPPKDDSERIDEIMVAAHLKPQNRGTRNNLDKKLVDGKATGAEKKQLLELYQELARLTPRTGDLDAWKARTGEVVAATKALIAGEEKAAERFVNARDCKACHKLHRPK